MTLSEYWIFFAISRIIYFIVLIFVWHKIEDGNMRSDGLNKIHYMAMFLPTLLEMFILGCIPYFGFALLYQLIENLNYFFLIWWERFSNRNI